ncbi:nitrite reductase, partial [Pseudomonas fluorescens]
MSACISPSESHLDAPPDQAETSLALRLVELTQEGLPLLEDPWSWLAEQLGLSVESTLDLLKRLQA